MAHAFDDFVLGGVSNPQFIICGDNLVDNQYFNDNLDGWSGDVGLTLSREETEYSYGKYMIHASTMSGASKEFWFEANTGSNLLADQEFIAIVRYQADEAWNFWFESNSITFGNVLLPATGTNIDGTPKVITRVFKGTVPSSTGSPLIRIVFDGYSWTSAAENLYVDNCFLAENYADWAFQFPQKETMLFQQYMNGEHTLWSNRTQRFDRKFRPVYTADWTAEYSGWEYRRQLIQSASNIIVMPHDDVNWGFVGRFNADFERKYAFDRYISHEMNVNIVGQEYIMELPEYISGSLKYS